MPSAEAALVCRTVDYQQPRPWTQDEKNSLPTLSAQLMDTASGNTAILVSDHVSTATVCFETILDLATVLTENALLAQYVTFHQQLDAAAQAEATRLTAFETEIASNDLCTAELAEVISRVETRRTTLRASVESQRVTNNTTISSAANNVAGVKAAMTTLNNVTAAELGQTVDEIASLATKIAKCVRARAR